MSSLRTIVLALVIAAAGCVGGAGSSTMVDVRGPAILDGVSIAFKLPAGDSWAATSFHVPASAWSRTTTGGYQLQLAGDADPGLPAEGVVGLLFRAVESGEMRYTATLGSPGDWSLGVVGGKPQAWDFLLVIGGSNITEPSRLRVGVAERSEGLPSAQLERTIGSGRATLGAYQAAGGRVESEGILVEDTRPLIAPNAHGAGVLRLTHASEAAGRLLHVASVQIGAEVQFGSWNVTAQTNRTTESFEGRLANAPGTPDMTARLTTTSTAGAQLVVAVSAESVEFGSSISVRSTIFELGTSLHETRWVEGLSVAAGPEVPVRAPVSLIYGV